MSVFVFSGYYFTINSHFHDICIQNISSIYSPLSIFQYVVLQFHFVFIVNFMLHSFFVLFVVFLVFCCSSCCTVLHCTESCKCVYYNIIHILFLLHFLLYRILQTYLVQNITYSVTTLFSVHDYTINYLFIMYHSFTESCKHIQYINFTYSISDFFST